MPLTPEDVVNKRFQPTKFREGYDQDEVDDFLDEIVVELRRLGQENEDLRQRLLASESRIAELQRSGAGLADQLNNPTAESALSPVMSNAPSAFPEATQDPSTLDSNNTNNLLQLARKLHEEHVRDGLAKRDALIAEGHATAARVVREAEAQQRADMSRLEQEKALIEHSIQELRSFEREYRIKLKTFIESQLEDLEHSESQNTNTGSTPAIEQNVYNPAFNSEPAAPNNPFQGDFGFGN
jgi:DivIVA domain-containing protein